MITILRELEVLKHWQKCCENKQIYEITYFLGTKWLVCNECLDLEEFSQDIKEKISLKLHKLSKQVPSAPINDLERGEREK